MDTSAWTNQPDGDPDFQGLIGCDECDTGWATYESLLAHSREIHPDSAQTAELECENDCAAD